ncbi:hypothetical protein D3C78_1222240 [compost metagenome]
MFAIFPLLGSSINAMPLLDSTFVISSLLEDTIHLGVRRSNHASDFPNGFCMDNECKKKGMETKQGVTTESKSLLPHKGEFQNAA